MQLRVKIKDTHFFSVMGTGSAVNYNTKVTGRDPTGATGPLLWN